MELAKLVNYGLIALRFHSDTRGRTTFTGGDSLIQIRAGTDPKITAAPLLAPSFLALHPALGTPFQYPDAAALVRRITSPQPESIPGIGYLEAQYHGPVRRGDIDKILFYGSDPEPETLKLIANHGLDWERLW
jgi:hypothetical protein